jgi:hypothetical protein
MHIFEQEISDGLEEKLKSQASISYACVVEPSNKTNHSVKHIKSLASLQDSDLYYVQSILVTSSWNKNDDIFDKDEVWAAKHTPEDKPTNLNHDENVIVGHITSNWPITDDGVLIDENTPVENLPNKFHILTGSVIYKGFSSEELMSRANTLISEIESGTKYVSMECFFKGFDYGLLNKSTGEFKVLNRNAETAFLTKHLRSYGGLGEHDNYKIGRVLRNITFSGKGFVDKPANPDSIIFTKDSFLNNSTEIFANLSNLGVFDNQSTLNVENTTMNSTQTETVASTEQTIVATPDVGTQTTDVVTETTTTTETVATDTALVDSLQTRIVELESQVASQLEIIEAAKKMKDEEKEETEKEEAAKKTKEEMAKKDEEMKKVKSELDAALEAIAGYKMKEQEMAKKEKKMKRKASLIDNGVDAESAETVVEKFETMADDAFEAMTSLFAGKMPPWLEKIKKGDDDKEDDKKAKDKKKASETSADPEVLDTVEVVEEVNLGVGGETESSVDTTRAALIDFVSSRLGKK